MAENNSNKLPTKNILLVEKNIFGQFLIKWMGECFDLVFVESRIPVSGVTGKHQYSIDEIETSDDKDHDRCIDRSIEIALKHDTVEFTRMTSSQTFITDDEMIGTTTIKEGQIAGH